MKVVLDAARCASLGMCESVAPAFFEVVGDGSLALLPTEAEEADRDLLEDAVAACPTGALSLQG